MGSADFRIFQAGTMHPFPIEEFLRLLFQGTSCFQTQPVMCSFGWLVCPLFYGAGDLPLCSPWARKLKEFLKIKRTISQNAKVPEIQIFMFPN